MSPIVNETPRARQSRRGNKAAVPTDPRVDVTRRIKQHIAQNGGLKRGFFLEYAQVLGMKPEENVVNSLMQTWSEVSLCRAGTHPVWQTKELMQMATMLQLSLRSYDERLHDQISPSRRIYIKQRYVCWRNQ